MRATITFEVQGSNHDELEEAALKQYANYLGKEEVSSLPTSTHMAVSQHVVSGDGTLIGWSAEVTIPVNNSTL